MKDIAGILLIVMFGGFLLFIPCFFIYCVVKSERDAKKQKIEDEAWLAAEKLKPKSSIEFITLDDIAHTTGPHEPYDTHPGSDWGYRRTSKQFADACLEGAYKRGYFMDEQRNSYPTCNIKSAKVVTNGQEKVS